MNMTTIPITLHYSIKPAGLFRSGVAKFVWIQFSVCWLWGRALRARKVRGWAQRNRGPQPTQPNWIQTNLVMKRRDQTGGLIESLKLKVPHPTLATPLSPNTKSDPWGSKNHQMFEDQIMCRTPQQETRFKLKDENLHKQHDWTQEICCFNLPSS